MKDEYIRKLRLKMDEINADIEKMKAKAGQMEADARLEYRRTVEDLESRRDSVEDKLRSLGESSESAWEDIRDGIDRSWGELTDAIRSASQKFR
jgi:hypothetical protein